MGVQKLAPARVVVAVPLLAGRQRRAQACDLLVDIGIRDAVFHLQFGLLQDERAIDEAFDLLVARGIAGTGVGAYQGLNGLEASLFIDIGVEHNLAIHDGHDAIHLCPRLLRHHRRLGLWHGDLMRGRLLLLRGLGVEMRYCGRSRRQQQHDQKGGQRSSHGLERLSDAEEELKVARLAHIWKAGRVVVEDRVYRRIQVIRQVEPNRTDRRVVADAQAGSV